MDPLTWAELAKVIPIAAIVSATVTLAIRWWDKPHPRLHLEGRFTARPVGDDDGASFSWGRAALLNLGNGDAYDVRVFGSGCDVGMPNNPESKDDTWTYRLPVLKAGETQILWVGVEKGATMAENDAIIVTWAPNRWWRRTIRFPVKKIAFEDIFPPGMLDYVKIPWWVRRTVSLERKSPRAQMYLRPPRKSEWETSADE